MGFILGQLYLSYGSIRVARASDLNPMPMVWWLSGSALLEAELFLLGRWRSFHGLHTLITMCLLPSPHSGDPFSRHADLMSSPGNILSRLVADFSYRPPHLVSILTSLPVISEQAYLRRLRETSEAGSWLEALSWPVSLVTFPDRLPCAIQDSIAHFCIFQTLCYGFTWEKKTKVLCSDMLTALYISKKRAELAMSQTCFTAGPPFLPNACCYLLRYKHSLNHHLSETLFHPYQAFLIQVSIHYWFWN